MYARPGRAPVLRAVTVIYLVWSLAPVAIVIAMSFNTGSSVTQWEGLGLRWWVGSPRSTFRDPDVRTALMHSILIASVATAIAVPIGTTLAIGLHGWRTRLARVIEATLLVALAAAPIMLAVSYYLLFSIPFRNVPFGEFGWFGTRAQIAALAMWALPYVVIVILVRLWRLNVEHEASAADLGAPPRDVVRRVILPQIRPVIFASVAMVFGLCMGEFVLTSALRSTDDTRPLSMALFGARFDPSPRFAVIGTTLALIGVIGFAAVLLAFRGTQGARRR